MTNAEWQACVRLKQMLALVPAKRYQRELRLFCTRCVRRVWSCLPDGSQDVSRTAIDVAERFAEGQASSDELHAACAAANRIAEQLAPNGDPPVVADYALSAVVDATSHWQRTLSNVGAVADCAAQAAGYAAAAPVDDDRYDDVLNSVQEAESAAQAELLRELIPLPPDAVASDTTPAAG